MITVVAAIFYAGMFCAGRHYLHCQYVLCRPALSQVHWSASMLLAYSLALPTSDLTHADYPLQDHKFNSPLFDIIGEGKVMAPTVPVSVI
jgi:hypothetical protein